MMLIELPPALAGWKYYQNEKALAESVSFG